MQRIGQIRKIGESFAQPRCDVRGTAITMPGILTQTYLLNRGYGVHATSWQEGEVIRLQLPKDHGVTEKNIIFYLTHTRKNKL